MRRSGTYEMAGLCRGSSVALILALALAAACAENPDKGVAGSGWQPESGPTESRESDRPVVQVPSEHGPAFLAPDANPRTALGRLRARHLPVWTPDFDWAFPPEACGTAWELDGIAEPTLVADVAVLGDFSIAAALAVMRYEHQFSGALADPNPLAQLCVATASVDPARSDALSVLESYLSSGARRAEPAAYPDEAWILAVSPSSALSVACVTPGYPTVVSENGAVVEAPRAPARLQAYRLAVSRGLEDQVIDISYRVSDTAHRPVENCAGLDAWALEWDGHVQTWIAEGQIWEPTVVILTAEGICDSPPPDGPYECPRDWPQ